MSKTMSKTFKLFIKGLQFESGNIKLNPDCCFVCYVDPLNGAHTLQHIYT